MQEELTLVIDIGKSHAKLLMFNEVGAVVERHGRENRSVTSVLGYPALDVQGLEDWMSRTLRSSANTAQCTRVMTSTHGAALVGLDEASLAWEPLDYEFDPLALQPQWEREFDAVADAFEQTLSPDLPAGLNAARQLFYMQRAHSHVWSRTRHLLPYPQYWAWRLCGVHASDVSSLGCHTHLWWPKTGEFSQLARSQGWATWFAPVRPAWEVLGSITPEVARTWGLPPHCVVHVGVHDSNACLARYLQSLHRDDAASRALTVVSSGTWTVLMAPGASTQGLEAERDMLANVDVLGRAPPPARFMGGREFECLLAGADPNAGSREDLQSLISGAIMALPSFAAQGGPFCGRGGSIRCGSDVFNDVLSAKLSEGQRAALAAMYCAQTTAWLVQRLWSGNSLARTVLVEGPLARNAMYLRVLQLLMRGTHCWVSHDPVEGTARGAWMLSRWGQVMKTDVKRVPPLSLTGIDEYHAAWQSALDGGDALAVSARSP